MATKPKSKWKDVVDFALKRTKSRNKRPEWRKFTNEKVNFLQDLQDLLVTFGSVIEKYDIKKILQRDEELIAQSISTCLDQEDKFWPFFEHVEYLIICDHLQFDSHHDDEVHDNLKTFYENAMYKLLDKDQSDILEDLLNHLRTKSKENVEHYNGIIHAHERNSPVLMAACRKDHFDVVKVLVRHGARLYTGHNMDWMSSWARYKQLNVPTVFMSTKDQISVKFRQNMFEGGDEVNDLHLLRLMAKKSYIVACYEVVVEKYMDEETGQIHDCDCVDRSAKFFCLALQVTNGFQMSLLEKGSYVNNFKKQHFCPQNQYFRPRMHCRSHVECNDPLFRCFDLAKLASEYADRIPEYREEYEDIAKQCRSLSVEILDQCSDTDEVQTVLKEVAGATKYFRYAKYIKYPRLRLAIEHNHKEFVGHMYCQQTLRQEWHGDVYWQGAPILMKILHFLFQFLLAPFLVCMAIIVKSAREIDRLGFDVDKRRSWPYNWISTICERSRSVRLNLDVPLNRFCIFSGWYAFFVGILVFSVFDLKTMTPTGRTKLDIWPDVPLIFYAISFLYQDINCLVVLRSFRTFIGNFWRMFDLANHLFLSSALVLMFIRTHVDLADEQAEVLNDWEGILFSLCSLFSINRLLYWLQLHEKIGPVVINMSRVLVDIFSMVGTYVLVAFAFTSGLVFIISTEHYTKSKRVLLNSTVYDNTNVTAYTTKFQETFILLIWTILDPGEKDEIDSTGLRGTFATFVMLMYQVTTIIILLNLLIAVMNSTVQRFQDRKQLYWKFTRTSVWIEFFDDHTSIPSPFVIIEIFWTLLLLLNGLCYWLVRCCQRIQKKRQESKISVKETEPCRFTEEVSKAREKHAKLMIKLLERYKDKVKDESEEHNKGIETIKQDLVRHLESMLSVK